MRTKWPIPNGIEPASGIALNDPVQPWLDRLNQEQTDLMHVRPPPPLGSPSLAPAVPQRTGRNDPFRNGASVCLAKEGVHWAVTMDPHARR